MLRVLQNTYLDTAGPQTAVRSVRGRRPAVVRKSETGSSDKSDSYESSPRKRSLPTAFFIFRTCRTIPLAAGIVSAGSVARGRSAPAQAGSVGRRTRDPVNGAASARRPAISAVRLQHRNHGYEDRGDDGRRDDARDVGTSASASTNDDGLSCETIFCATLAVVGTQLTAAMPMTGLKLPRLMKYMA